MGVTTMAGGSENYHHPVVPIYIPATPFINSNMITITYYIGYLEIPRREPIEAEIGLPGTPDQNSTLFTNEGLIGDGYNSSRYLGPPRNDPGWKKY